MALCSHPVVEALRMPGYLLYLKLILLKFEACDDPHHPC